MKYIYNLMILMEERSRAIQQANLHALMILGMEINKLCHYTKSLVWISYKMRLIRSQSFRNKEVVESF